MSLSISCTRIKQKIKDKSGDAKEIIINFIKEPAIKKAVLFDKYPALKAKKYNVVLDDGLECDFIPSFYKYYFRYTGNKAEILNFIANIKPNSTEVESDTICNRIDLNQFKTKTKPLTVYEKRAASFFFDYLKVESNNLEFYSCLKAPEVHYLAIDTKTKDVYHMIDNFWE